MTDAPPFVSAPETGRASRKRNYPVIVRRGGGRYGAYAPEVPGSFVTAATVEDARRLVRDEIASRLRLLLEMSEDEVPEPEAEVLDALAEATNPNLGHPVDPSVRVLVVEVGPEDAPPDAPSVPPRELAVARTHRPRPETFAAVFTRAPDGYSGEVPDLPGCLSMGDTLADMRRNMREAIHLHVQSSVDDHEPIPERRRSPAEALAHYYEDEYNDPDNPYETATSELVTVPILPPRPQARLLTAMWRRACREEDAFEKASITWMPLPPGESWKGSYAATILAIGDLRHGNVADLPLCNALGATRDELHRNLRAAISERLLESLSSGGTIPLPRRTAELATARYNLRSAEMGFDEFPDPDVTVEMVAVEITAPAIARAS